MLKKIAMLFGWIYLVVGILGFVPGITTKELLLGIFHVNAMHNLVHIVAGLAALYLANQGEESSRMFFKVFGVIYGLVALLGFMVGDGMVLGFVANNMADTWLHVVLAVVSLYLGFGSKQGSSTQTV